MSQKTWRWTELKVGDVIIAVGLMILLLPVVGMVQSSMLQARARAIWNQQSQSGNVQPNDRAMAINIEKIGLSAVVVEQRSEADLARGPVHLAGTSYPGLPGNCCIAAHKEKWFKRLHNLKLGDTVNINHAGKSYTYIVMNKQTVPETDLSVISKTSGSTLTLITCVGRPYFSMSDHRLVVKAVLK